MRKAFKVTEVNCTGSRAGKVVVVGGNLDLKKLLEFSSGKEQEYC